MKKSRSEHTGKQRSRPRSSDRYGLTTGIYEKKGTVGRRDMEGKEEERIENIW